MTLTHTFSKWLVCGDMEHVMMIKMMGPKRVQRQYLLWWWWYLCWFLSRYERRNRLRCGREREIERVWNAVIHTHTTHNRHNQPTNRLIDTHAFRFSRGRLKKGMQGTIAAAAVNDHYHFRPLCLFVCRDNNSIGAQRNPFVWLAVINGGNGDGKIANVAQANRTANSLLYSNQTQMPV